MTATWAWRGQWVEPDAQDVGSGKMSTGAGLVAGAGLAGVVNIARLRDRVVL